jgi:ABC-type nitrate/sulfonate/bicarbonate transport system substrate-binding protein
MKEYVPNAKMEQFASGSTGILQAMASGTVQMGVAITDSVLAAIAQGVPVTIVASWESSPVEQAVFVSSNSSITSISQLKGATLAVTGPTSLSATVAKIMAAQQGWGSSYSLSSVGSVPACVAAVESGSATASLLDPFESIFSSPSLRVIGLVNETWPEFSVVATNAFIAAHPDAVRATLAMLGYANNFFNTNPAGQAEQFMATYPLYNMTTTQYNYFMALSHWSSDGTIHSLEYQAAINELYAYKVISTNLTASSVYSGEFVSVVP